MIDGFNLVVERRGAEGTLLSIYLNRNIRKIDNNVPHILLSEKPDT